MAASSSSRIFEGRRLAYYGKRRKLLGQGTYGKVWATSGGYALKEVQLGEPSLTQDVLSEIVFPGAVRHPGVIRYHDVYLESDKVIFVMDQYPGDLSKVRIPDKETFRSVAYQLISTVAYLGSLNILHRDIKPANVLYRACPTPQGGVDYRCVLADFGLAAAKSCLYLPDDWNVYTLWFRPPEILLKVDHYTLAADVWALGCTLYAIYTGRYLFFGQNKNEMVLQIGERMSTIPEEEMKSLGDKLRSKSVPRMDVFRMLGARKPDLRLVEDDHINDLLVRMLDPDPARRASIFDLQNHSLFEGFSGNPSCYEAHPTPLSTCFERVLLFDRNVDYSRAPVAHGDYLNLAEWVYDILLEFELKKETYFGIMEMWYRYMARNEEIPTEDHQLYLVAIVYLCVQFWDSVGLSLDTCVRITYDKYREAQILEAAKEILRDLDYDLLASTRYDYLMAQQTGYPSRVIRLAGEFLVIMTLDDRLYSVPTIVDYCINMALAIHREPHFLDPQTRELFRRIRLENSLVKRATYARKESRGAR